MNLFHSNPKEKSSPFFSIPGIPGFTHWPPTASLPLAKELILKKKKNRFKPTPHSIMCRTGPCAENMLPWELRQIVGLWIIKIFFFTLMKI